MNIIFALYVSIVNPLTGETETQRVNSINYKDQISCIAEKSTYREDDYIKFFCKKEK